MHQDVGVAGSCGCLVIDEKCVVSEIVEVGFVFVVIRGASGKSE